MLQMIYRLFSQKGQGIVEYALLLGFMAVVTVILFGDDSLADIFTGMLKGIMNQFTRFNEP